jgi:hypothetical protein
MTSSPFAFERTTLICTLLAAAVVFFPLALAIAMQAGRLIQ